VSASRSLLAAVVALALAAGPAAAQSTEPGGTATLPGATVTVPGAGTPSVSTQPELTADQVQRGILLDAADRVELAQALAEATEESGVCFGYEVQLGGNTETLTNAGPDKLPETATGCPKGSVELDVNIIYTAESSESNDSASFRIDTDVPGLTSSAALRRLKDLTGIDDDDFLGDKDDLALRNATAALPLLLDGATPAELPAASTTASAPNGDRLTNPPASDWIRAHGLGIGIAFAVLLLAVILIVGGIIARRQAGQPKRPLRPPPSASGSSGSSSSTPTTP
jgi:hypothetical protein